ncbi:MULTISPECIES: hypothetical protein [Streptomyces]|uniref:Uncharacterized protein n=2 Tax=Streptomyces TaxID=1883 RepID=A0A2U9PE36_STRAS|nr:hypothetical protein [Streptomyces actuosus]AWT47131.1 hypothetical protein DMT42_36035 [Streptomyces actuosus]MBM4823675.1 hypothetical protein [Streptomyces actuosus]
MASPQPIVVYPPGEDGGRRVRVDGRFVGMAYGPLDIVEFLRLAGLDDVDDDWVRASALIEWRGGGAEVWEH